MNEVKLNLIQVKKAFGDNLVLNGIDLEVVKGEMTCLIGASGSGKSTLLRCMNGLELIDDGEIWFNGLDIAEPGIDLANVRRRIGIVFQSFNLFPHMNALDNVALAPMKVLGKSRQEVREQAEDLFRRFGLLDHMHKYADQLSGGQQQRVAIIRALAMQPEIILFDEITSALDPVLVAEVLEMLRQLRGEGMTMVMATHEMNFARELADCICFMEDGVIVESGSPAQILGEPREQRTQAFLKSVLN
ncbi:MAG: amino acid ABC transporter ATP-binding protein [Hyphomicrobiales bacterium]|nr:amino acid ABC transporter ATP-binding protein [Hyphomicrobiales bacterium]